MFVTETPTLPTKFSNKRNRSWRVHGEPRKVGRDQIPAHKAAVTQRNHSKIYTRHHLSL